MVGFFAEVFCLVLVFRFVFDLWSFSLARWWLVRFAIYLSLLHTAFISACIYGICPCVSLRIFAHLFGSSSSGQGAVAFAGSPFTIVSGQGVVVLIGEAIGNALTDSVSGLV